MILGNTLRGVLLQLLGISLESRLAVTGRAISEGNFVHSLQRRFNVWCLVRLLARKPDGCSIPFRVPDHKIGFVLGARVRLHVGCSQQPVAIRCEKEHRVGPLGQKISTISLVLYDQMAEAHSQRTVRTRTNRQPHVGLGSQVDHLGIDDDQLRSFPFALQHPQASILPCDDGVCAPHDYAAGVAVVASFVRVEHATVGHMRLGQVGKEADVSRGKGEPRDTDSGLETGVEVVRSSARALRSDDGLRPMLFPRLLDLLHGGVERFIPADALPLARASWSHTFHGVLQPVGVRMDLLSGERLRAQHPLADGMMGISLHLHDIVAFDVQEHPALAMAIETNRPDNLCRHVPSPFLCEPNVASQPTIRSGFLRIIRSR